MFGMLEVTDNPLNYSGEIDRPGEFCYNMSALYHLTKMDCCPARFFDCYSYSRTFLDLFLSFNLVFFFCSCFPPIGKFGLLLPQFPSTFRQTQKWMPKSGRPFFIAQLMIVLVLIGTIFDHLRNIPSEVIFKLDASTAAAEFCEWVQVVIDVHISHRKYYVKPYSSPWLSAALIEITSFVCTLLRYSSGTILQIAVAGTRAISQITPL